MASYAALFSILLCILPINLTLARAIPPHGLGFQKPLTSKNSVSSTISPKVFIFNAFVKEADSFYNRPEINLLANNITVPGLSPKFPQAHCTSDGQVCQLATGEGEINAASSVAALVNSGQFDLTQTYILIAGIAGVNPREVSIGSVTLARYEVQVAQQYQIDVRDLGLNFSTGYIPYKTKLPAPDEYPQGIYGTEVFEVNNDLRQLAYNFALKATLNDTTEAASYRSNFPYAPANQPPAVVQCDGATSDVYFSGPILLEGFTNFTTLLTNGSATMCASAQEDSAMLEALMRGHISGLVDFARIIVMRSASDSLEAPPDFSAYQHFLWEKQGGTAVSLENLYRTGIQIVQGILDGWEDTFGKGVKASNYIGDLWGSLGGAPDFGPYPFFAEN